MVENVKHEVSHKLNIPFEQYLKQINKSEEEIISSFAEEAKNRVKKFLVLREIGNKEKIEVPESEVEEELNKALRRYPDRKETADKKNTERLMEYNRGILKNEKIFNILESLTKK
jgi:FKBP-type peptidyl-prolyl cis-trans isomerase (trigger factor)